MDSRRFLGGVALTILLGASTAADATTLADRCEASKLRAAGAYGLCRARSHAKGVIKGDPPTFDKCEERLTRKWLAAESRFPGQCPTTGDQPSVQQLVESDSNDLALHLSGGTFPQCGDGIRNLNEQCDGSDLAGQQCGNFGFLGGTLSCSPSCTFDVGQCGGHELPATGQSTVYVVGDDGDVQAGSPLAFVDNGDGTITDLNTRLMWEKKDDSAGLHDKDTNAVWDHFLPGSIWQWIAQINAEGGTGFAGYSDWRIPNVRELQSIVDYGHFLPGSPFAVTPEFNNNCTADCAVLACSCTAPSPYWSSTTRATGLPGIDAWAVNFSNGGVSAGGYGNAWAVRAVRSAQ